MKKIKFFECVDCGTKVKKANGDWDFGCDFDAVEADEDGGVRGYCDTCRKKLQEEA